MRRLAGLLLLSITKVVPENLPQLFPLPTFFLIPVPRLPSSIAIHREIFRASSASNWIGTIHLLFMIYLFPSSQSLKLYNVSHRASMSFLRTRNLPWQRCRCTLFLPV